MSFLVAGGLVLSTFLVDIVLDDIVGAKWFSVKDTLCLRMRILGTIIARRSRG
jgi:hypothetical protein